MLSSFLGLAGNITPVVAQQRLLAGKPQLLSNLLGGNSKVSIAGVAVDAAGNVYLAGATSSADLRTEHAAQVAYGGGTDAFIAKLDPAGNVLYASYLGGGAQDWATGIAVDSANNAYLTGWTASTDFPTRFAAQPSLRGRRNGFVAKFSPDGALIYSTYLGGSGDDAAAAIAVDSEGSAYVTGAAASLDFPVVRAMQARTGGGVDAFVTKLGAFGDIQYSTYIGGGALDRGQGIAVDSAGRAYVAGVTASYDFPFKNPFRGYAGGTDGFVARLNAEGDGLEYSTWIGGSGNEEVSGVAVDSLDRAYVTGWTDSRDFPLVHPLQDSLRGGEDAFVIRLTPAGEGLSYSTYLGGSGADRGLAIAADAAGRAYVTGWTRSPDFPANSGGNASQKAWLAELSPAGTQLDYNSYAGSGEADEGRAVALAASGDVFVAGETSTPASQDGFLVRFSQAETRSDLQSRNATGLAGNPIAAAANGVHNLTVTQAAQTITFGALASVRYGAGPFTIKATASSGLPVRFTTGARTVCMVAGDLVTVLGAGTCWIQANQAGNIDLAAAPTVTQNLTVKPANPSGTLAQAAGNPIAVGTNPDSVAVGDFNGDGIQDLAVSNYGGNNVTILLGDGSGGFSPAMGSPFAAGSGPRSVAVGDFNADGIQDLAVTSPSSNNVTILLGSGSGGFSAATGSPFPAGAGPVSLAVGDFNGDGIPDLATADYSSNSVTVLLGNGSGGFSAALGSPFPVGTNPESVAVGDFNGDGIPDLATANYASNNVTLLLGNGLGGFSAAPESPFFVGSTPASMAVGDFNGDGLPDLATASLSDDRVTVLLGNGSGSFSAAAGSPFAVGIGPLSLAVGDFNGDGIQDLATADFASNNVTVLLGNASGSFSAATGSPFAVGASPAYVAVGDFNGDGRTDLVAATDGNNLTLLLGGSAATSAVLSETASSIVADGISIPLTLNVFDSAFNAPIGTATFLDGTTVLGAATQTTSPYSFSATGLAAGSHTLTATYSGDNRSAGSTSNTVTITVNPSGSTLTILDLIPASARPGGLAFTLTVNGSNFVSGATVQWGTTALTTTFVSATQLTAAVAAVQTATAGNVSVTVVNPGPITSAAATFTVANTLTTTILVSSASPSVFGQAVTLTANVAPIAATGKVTFYEGSTVIGTGTLADGTAQYTTTLLPAGPGMLKAYYAGDVTYAASMSAPTSQMVNANPSGTLRQTAGSPIAVGTGPQSLAVGDFNGDGNQDVAIANNGSNDVTVLLGNGSGGFSPATGSPFAAGAGPVSLAVADFNADGIQDLAVANSGSNNVTILLGNGSGGFSAAAGSPFTVGTYPVSLAVGDFNEDGIQDLAIANNTSNDVTVLLGNGSGGFSPAAGSPLAIGAFSFGLSSIAAGDFNGDGIPDLATANNGSNDVTLLLGNGSGGFSAAPRSPVAVGTTPITQFTLAVGDFNGDGIQDLAVSNSRGGSVAILLGNGVGGFIPASGEPFYVNAPGSVTVGDFNGDGIQDLAVSDYSDGGVTILLGNGSGGFSAATTSPVAVGPHRFTQLTLAVGDFNRDGRTDVVAVSSATNDVTVLLGGSATTGSLLSATASSIVAAGTSIPLTLTVFDSTFSAPTGTATFLDGTTVLGTAIQTTSPYSFSATGLAPGTHTLTATYSGDSRSAGSTSNTVTITINPSSSTLTISSLMPASARPGGPDFTLTVNGSNFVSGATVQWGATALTTTFVSATQLTAAVSASQIATAGTVSITVVNPGPIISAAATFTVTETVTVTMLVSSANPSVFGQAVTLTANVSPAAAMGNVTFYEGSTVLGIGTLRGGVAELRTTLLPTGTGTLKAYYAGDLNYYPDEEVYAPSTSQPIAQTVNANLSGMLIQAAGSPFFAGYEPRSVVVADFNGDGVQDIAVAGGYNYLVSVLLGNGAGGFNAAPGSPFPAATEGALAVGDFNGDGIPDLVVINDLASVVTVLLGDGAGGFSPAVGSPLALGAMPGSLAVGDFNGDGNEDLAIANADDNTVSILLGDGAGGLTFAAGSPYAVGTLPGAIASGDFNGDGFQDIVTANFLSNDVTVLLGNGTGGFSPTPGSPFVVGSHAVSIAVGDVNGDGFQDIIAGGSGVTVLLGNGGGGFSPAAGSPFTTGVPGYTLALGDLNGDGFQDVALPYDTKLLGDGAGGFVLAPGNRFSTSEYVGSSELVAIGDFNGDGRADLAYVDEESGVVSILLGGSAATRSVLSTVAPSSIPAGTPIPLTLTVFDTGAAFNAPTGTVTFLDGTTPLGAAGQTGSPYTFSATGLTLGSHTLTATYSGDTRSVGSNSNSITIQVLPAQTIAFGALATQIVGSPPFTLNASASSGLPVAFASNSTGVCTVSGAMLTLVAAGTCSITASQPGDNVTYGPAAPVTVTFTVEPSFGDVSSSNESAAFITAIDDMLSKGISAGCQASPLEYCPSQDVTRGQMAVFIIRSIYGSSNFTYSQTPYFTDATPGAVGGFFPFIQKMRELGITSGCTTTTFCPDDNVTRGQMAVFIILARYGSLEFDYPATPYFSDVTTASVGGFFKYIQRMKQDNITGGCTPTTYCPDQNVTRDQMAVFLMVGGFNLAAPTTPVLRSASPATGGLGETINVTLTAANTHFVQDTTTVTAGAGITVGTVTVNSATSVTAQLTIASNATPNPVSLLVTTGTEEAVLPNGFTITSDPAAGVNAYWNGNGTTANSISSLSGTLMSGATYASATSRTLGLADAQAFSLNGTSSYVQAAAGEVGTVSGARTLAAWVYPNASSGLGMPILTGSDIFGITGTTGTCSSGGQYQLYIDDAGTCYVSDISLAPGVWSFVAVTFDGSKVVFYIDGVASVAVPAAQMSSYGLVTLEIGGNTLGGSSSGASFNGLLSEVQVYNRALTPAEIQGLYAP